MEEILKGVYKVLPTKVTDSKYPSFFVRRPSGNLLFPCFSNSSTIHGNFDEIAAMGGLKYQLLYGWKAFPTKPGRPKMIESLRQLADLDFDVLLANTRISNPHCYIELNEQSRRALMDSIIARL